MNLSIFSETNRCDWRSRLYLAIEIRILHFYSFWERDYYILDITMVFKIKYNLFYL